MINDVKVLKLITGEEVIARVSEEEKIILKKRATFTSTLLCIVFSYLYVMQVFN